MLVSLVRHLAWCTTYSTHSTQLFAIAYLIAIIILRDNGLGFSGKVLSPEHMVNQVRTTLAIQVIYYILINTIKSSILFFYLRIGKTRYCKAGESTTDISTSCGQAT